jgi:2-polyprenyl-6-methoxyphenol hydroxylase-like FAD-dependent oxidoreductase
MDKELGHLSKTPGQCAQIEEPSRSLPVCGAYDVVVAGGGIAGVAAAIAARRAGVSVCLLEKTCALGGLATLGNVSVYLPLCDGKGRQVIAGLGEELLKLSVSDLRKEDRQARFAGIPACWLTGGDREKRKRVRYQVEFNPASFLLRLEKLVVEAGVKLLYDTRLCAVRGEGECITHLVVENKSGRSAIACRSVVDATGDADVCYLAGEETESLDSNVLCGWFYHLDSRGLHLHALSNNFSPYALQEGAEGPFFRGDDAEQVTAQILGSRDLIRQRLDQLRHQHPDEEIQPVSPPTIAGFRMTRRLVSSFSLAERHVHQWFEDTIGLTGDWRRGGPVYAIPLRALHGERSRNLLAAGRCISADTTAWDVTRAIPTCAVTGEAAGAAAALAVQHSEGDVHALPTGSLQKHLRSQGVLLEPEK